MINTLGGEITRAIVIELAKDWIGTPYLHGQSRFRYGSDCLGLVMGVWRDLYGCQYRGQIPPYRANWREIDPDLDILGLMSKAMIRLDNPLDAKAGDVVLFSLKEGLPPKHMGILSNDKKPWGADGRLIHAYWGQGVLESSLRPFWEGRAKAAFSFPPLETWR
jgi:NlpC/P60 family putative phage cell wall peptidase